ncbi:MAG: hypothetical protein IKM61_07445 [Eubacteriaceae bacterium]|nr:hypothetical protein [Eubacteriaceae bacterium]
MLKKITSIFLISALLLCLFACSGEKPMTGRELPPDTETLKTLSEEYDENLFYEERDRSADRVNFVLKETQNQGSDLVGVIAGKKNDDNIVNMTFTAGGIVYNDQLLSDLAVTPEDIAPTLTYLAKIYGIEDTDILYDTFSSEFPDKNTEETTEDGITKITYETEINGLTLRLRFRKPSGSTTTALIFAGLATDFGAFGL